MNDTGFRPSPGIVRTAPRHDSAAYVARIAPTEKVHGVQSYLGGAGAGGREGERVLRGEVHDPTANRMGGVAGHAGLFSTADDLAIFCQMILNGGEYKGVRI